jgi:hypothetical protein
MAEEKMTYSRAEKVLGLKDGSIAAHKAELKQMKEEMVTYLLSDIDAPEPEEVEAADDIVDGLLDIATRYGMRKIFVAEFREDK